MVDGKKSLRKTKKIATYLKMFHFAILFNNNNVIFYPCFLLVQGSSPSSLAAEIAKARQHIKNSLECVSTLIIFMHIVLQFITYANIDFEVVIAIGFFGVVEFGFFIETYTILIDTCVC